MDVLERDLQDSLRAMEADIGALCCTLPGAAQQVQQLKPQAKPARIAYGKCPQSVEDTSELTFPRRQRMRPALRTLPNIAMAPPKPNIKKLGYTKSVGADDDNVLTPRTRSRCQLFVTIVLVLACIWVLLPLALMPEEPQASSWEQPYDGRC